MKEILEILNPVHLPTCGEWMKIADILKESYAAKTYVTRKNKAGEDITTPIGQNPFGWSKHIEKTKQKLFHKLISRFEELTRGKWAEERDYEVEVGNHKVGNYTPSISRVFQPALLTKDRFVCEVEKPRWTLQMRLDSEEYKNTVKEWWENHGSKVWFEGFELEEQALLTCGSCYIIFSNLGARLGINDREIKRPSIFDLIIELDHYNRTAKEPIKIMWTEAFLTQLLND